jgi:tetratricopeptide (TPR) repeat protein
MDSIDAGWAMFRMLGLLSLSLLLVVRTGAAEDLRAGGDTAERFAAALGAADADAINALIHVDALAARVLDGMPEDAPQRADYHARLRESAATLGQSIAAQLAAGGGVARVVARRPDGPLVRITLRNGGRATGHNYYRLRLHDDGRVADWYDHALGMWTSDTLRFTSASLLSSGDLALLLFRDREALQHAAAVRRVALHLQVGDQAGAYEALQSLPEDVLERRDVATMAYGLSRAIGVAAYRENLARVARLYGDDPQLQFALIDHYMLESKFDRMLAAVASIEREFGADEVVLNNRCAALVGLKRYAEALTACDAVLAIDPKDDTALWTRVRMALEQGDAAQVVAALRRVEDATGTTMDFESLGRREAYAGVRDAPEFKALVASRSEAQPR